MENVGEGVMAATVHEESPNLDEAMESPLLGVPEEVLLHICHFLPASDLVRLGWTCHRLRVVCRSPFAWDHVQMGPEFYPPDDYLNMNGVLRIAPALHTLALSGYGWGWPTVDLLCCTRIVKVLVFDFAGRQSETRVKNQLYRTILHYRHYLEKVDLSWCHDMKIFRLVDGLKNIRELCVAGSLVKTYPGSRTTVSVLKLGHCVSADVAAEIIRANRNNLTSFTVDPLVGWDHRRVLFESPAVSAVWRELSLCTGLHEASIPMIRNMSFIDRFPQLHTLTIRSVDMKAHSFIECVLEASQVMRGLRKLILEMGVYPHRGLIKVVASSCTSLRELHLINCYRNFTAPRDLHVILGHIGDLESLTLSAVRVPSTVFRGMAAGALPRLTEINVTYSEVTQRGHDALEAMRTRRPDLQVIVEDGHKRTVAFGHRCPVAICQDGSDCSEDPSDDEFIDF